MCIRDRYTDNRFSMSSADAGIVAGSCWTEAACGTNGLGTCLLYTSDAADERSSVDLGGRRIIKKKNKRRKEARSTINEKETIASHNLNTEKQEIVKKRDH